MWRFTVHLMARNDSEMTEEAIVGDAVIVGGGLIGLTLGCALAGAGLRSVVIERADPATWADTAFDGRTIAVAQGSKRALAAIGLWPLLADDACPIDDIRVTDRQSPLFLHYDSTELDEGPLGYIVENRKMRMALVARAAALPGLTLLAPAALTGVVRGGARVTASLADGRTVRAPVVLACDGRGSRLRADAEIDTWQWRYHQQAMVCTIRHAQSHQNIAHERFLEGGPFAILPMLDDPEGPAGMVHRSSIVWTERAALVPGLMAASEEEFTRELAARVGGFLGEIAVVGPRQNYPLSLSHARHYTARRLALVGDAAHAIHPIAGQGWNMGLRDVAALSQLLVDARRLGLDPGSTGVLTEYEAQRRFDNSLLSAVTDGLNRFFGINNRTVSTAREVGLAMVNRTPPVRRALMRHAMGLPGGDAPRLLQGQAL